MSLGLVGRKCGMTRIFSESGVSFAVTVVEILQNRVVQVKTLEKDGYAAIQVTTGGKKVSRLNKAQIGHFSKAGVIPGRGLWEFKVPVNSNDFEFIKSIAPGAEICVDKFKVGQLVDVTSFCSQGKGFAGTVKRWNFRGGDATHGNSLAHRKPGSIGQRQSPGKVFKGKKMSGRMGGVRRTVELQKVIRVDQEKNLLFILGGVPGATGGDVLIRPSNKASEHKEEKS